MSALHTLFARFHHAIETGDATDAAPDIKPNPRLTAEQQCAIYGDGYEQRLISALRADYPALLGLLGPGRFDRVARGYIAASPPRHFNLDRYPHGFATYIAAHPIPAIGDFAVDLARLECAIAQVFMMPESLPLDAAALSPLTPESFGALTLQPCSASQLLALRFDAHSYCTAYRAGSTPPVPPRADHYLCLVRHRHEVTRHPLAHAQYLLLLALGEGLPIETALATVIAEHPVYMNDLASHLQSWFKDWITHGFFRHP